MPQESWNQHSLRAVHALFHLRCRCFPRCRGAFHSCARNSSSKSNWLLALNTLRAKEWSVVTMMCWLPLNFDFWRFIYEKFCVLDYWLLSYCNDSTFTLWFQDRKISSSCQNSSPCGQALWAHSSFMQRDFWSHHYLVREGISKGCWCKSNFFLGKYSVSWG